MSTRVSNGLALHAVAVLTRRGYTGGTVMVDTLRAAADVLTTAPAAEVGMLAAVLCRAAGRLLAAAADDLADAGAKIRRDAGLDT